MTGSLSTEELLECIDLEMYSNFCGSFAINSDEDITKAREKADYDSLSGLTGGGPILQSTLKFGNKHVSAACARCFVLD